MAVGTAIKSTGAGVEYLTTTCAAVFAAAYASESIKYAILAPCN